MSKFLLNTTELWHIANASLRIAVLLMDCDCSTIPALAEFPVFFHGGWFVIITLDVPPCSTPAIRPRVSRRTQVTGRQLMQFMTFNKKINRWKSEYKAASEYTYIQYIIIYLHMKDIEFSKCIAISSFQMPSCLWRYSALLGLEPCYGIWIEF